MRRVDMCLSLAKPLYLLSFGLAHRCILLHSYNLAHALLTQLVARLWAKLPQCTLQPSLDRLHNEGETPYNAYIYA